MDIFRIISSVLLASLVIVITMYLQFIGWIDIIANFTDVWVAIASFLLGVALMWFISGISKKDKNVIKKDEIKKDEIYGTNVGSVHKGVHHFNTQNELPDIKEVLECAKQKIEILAWTGEDITTQHIDAIKDAIKRNIQVTFMLLALDSEIAQKGSIASDTIDLSQRTQKSLKILCDMRNKLGNKKQNLIIRKYYVDNNYSMIILDSASNNAWIQVTSYVKGKDASSRYSDSAYKKKNERFFNQHFDDYSAILKKSKEHKCKYIQHE